MHGARNVEKKRAALTAGKIADIGLNGMVGNSGIINKPASGSTTARTAKKGWVWNECIKDGGENIACV